MSEHGTPPHPDFGEVAAEPVEQSVEHEVEITDHLADGLAVAAEPVGRHRADDPDHEGGADAEAEPEEAEHHEMQEPDVVNAITAAIRQ